jgi:hypothetical protein
MCGERGDWEDKAISNHRNHHATPEWGNLLSWGLQAIPLSSLTLQEPVLCGDSTV